MNANEISSLIHAVERETYSLQEGSFHDGVEWALDLIQYHLKQRLVTNDQLSDYLMKKLEQSDKVIKIDKLKVENPYLLEVEANKLCMHADKVKRVEIEDDFVVLYK